MWCKRKKYVHRFNEKNKNRVSIVLVALCVEETIRRRWPTCAHVHATCSDVREMRTWSGCINPNKHQRGTYTRWESNPARCIMSATITARCCDLHICSMLLSVHYMLCLSGATRRLFCLLLLAGIKGSLKMLRWEIGTCKQWFSKGGQVSRSETYRDTWSAWPSMNVNTAF